MADKEIHFKKWFEANFLDGDDVYDCGKAMLSAESVYEALDEWLPGILNQQRLEARIDELQSLLDMPAHEMESWGNEIEDRIAMNKADLKRNGGGND